MKSGSWESSKKISVADPGVLDHEIHHQLAAIASHKRLTIRPWEGGAPEIDQRKKEAGTMASVWELNGQPTTLVDYTALNAEFTILCYDDGEIEVDGPLGQFGPESGHFTGLHEAGINYHVTYNRKKTHVTIRFGLFSAYTIGAHGGGFSIEALALGSGGGFGIQWTFHGRGFKHNDWFGRYRWKCVCDDLEGDPGVPDLSIGVDGEGNSIPL